MWASWADAADDYDTPDFIRVRHVRAARKEHKCNMCGEIIPVGKPYDAVSYRIDGQFVYDHVHDSQGSCLTYAEMRRDPGTDGPLDGEFEK